MAALNKRPEFSRALTTYNPNYPQYMVDVDVAKAKQAGTSPAAILSVLQGYYGGMYASNFNAYGKLFRVMIQGTVESRMNEDGLTNIYVRTAGGMAPVSEFCTLKRVYGPSNITRFTSLPLSQSMLHQLMVTLLVRLFRLQRRLQNKYCHRVMVMSSLV